MKRRLFLSGMIGAAAASQSLSHAAGMSLQGVDAGKDEAMKYRVELIIDGISVFKYATRIVRAKTCEYGNTGFEIVGNDSPLFEIDIVRNTTAVGAWMRMPERFVNAGLPEWTRLAASQRMPIDLTPGDVLVVNKT